MAILKNLLVTGGASRFLGHIYCQDISVSGTATLSSLSLSGNLSVTGTSTLTGHVSIGGYNNASYGLSASSAIINSWIRTTGSTGWYNESHGGGWYMTDNDYVRSYGKPVMMGHNMFFGSTSYYVHTNGAANFSTVSSSAANIATLNATNVNVTNNLRANHYDLQTVAQLGGSFYVSPTVKFPNSGTTLKVEKSGSTLTLTITDSSITSTTMAGVVWSANSRVKVSGTINGVVTGTMDGTVSSINTSSHTLTLSVSGENSASVVAGTYTASQFSDLTVMIYQRRDGSNDYRVGIWMNCYDVANSSSTIRIYGGSDANPNVMLGNLTSAGLGTVNNLTPTGWGLFAQNAFLHGKVVANGGLIGNWTIGTTGMYYNSDAPSSTSITMIPGGTSASTTSIGGSSGSKQWIFTGKNLFGIDTDGKLYASSAEISGKITANTGHIGGTSGWTIASQQLSSGTIGADNSMFLGTKNLGSNTTIANRSGSDWRFTVGSSFGVTNTGALYATSATIGGTISGATITGGTISGTVITAGGSNTNGELVVKNSSGERVGLINGNGLYFGNIASNLSAPNTSIDTNGAIKTKSLKANNYVYVDGDSSSYFNIPMGKSGTYTRVTSTGFYVKDLWGNECFISNSNFNERGFRVRPSNASGTSSQEGATLKGSGLLVMGVSPRDYAKVDYDEIILKKSADGFPMFLATLNGYNQFTGKRVMISGAEFSVTGGTKNRVVETEHYAKRTLTCYEMPSPMFGDIGEGTIGEDGLCYVSLDPIFLETISKDCAYQVFLQKYGEGECYVSERKPTYFIVVGEPNLNFAWELKAKQIDFDQQRLPIFEEPIIKEPGEEKELDYGTKAMLHIRSIINERSLRND